MPPPDNQIWHFLFIPDCGGQHAPIIGVFIPEWTWFYNYFFYGSLGRGSTCSDFLCTSPTMGEDKKRKNIPRPFNLGGQHLPECQINSDPFLPVFIRFYSDFQGGQLGPEYPVGKGVIYSTLSGLYSPHLCKGHW